MILVFSNGRFDQSNFANEHSIGTSEKEILQNLLKELRH